MESMAAEGPSGLMETTMITSVRQAVEKYKKGQVAMAGGPNRAAAGGRG